MIVLYFREKTHPSKVEYDFFKSSLPDKIKSLYSGFIYNFTVFITVSYIFQTLPARNIEARLCL